MLTIDDRLTESLHYISIQLNRYFALIILLFGAVGNIINCFVLTQRILKSNPCAFLFLVSSTFDLISIFVGLTTRILEGWNLDPSGHINWICKLRAFTVFTTRTVPIWLITLATIDRYLLSLINFHYRQMSTLKNAKRGTIISIALAVILYVYMFYCYEANMIDAPLECYEKSFQCGLTTDIIYGVFSITIPSIIMIIFCIMIVINVHDHHNRIRPNSMVLRTRVVGSQQKQLKSKKTDNQLLRMLLLQVLLLVLFCIPQIIQKFYNTFQPFQLTSKQNSALYNLLYNLAILLTYIASGMPFYVYTLSGGKLFRKATIDLFTNVKEKLKICCLNLSVKL